MRWLGDYDRDRDVDLRDVAYFQACFTGSEGSDVSLPCSLFDFDTKDGHIDLHDFRHFVVALDEL